MQHAHLAETQQSLRPTRPEHQQGQRQHQQFEGGENCEYHVDPKTGWRAVLRRATGKPSGSVLHLQLHSGKLHNGKRVGAHDNLHHLRNGCDFGFFEGIPENRWGV